MKHYLLLILFLFGLAAKAQIGYQISLLNHATGEPRANETVSVDVTLTDGCGVMLYNNSCMATTNDFGVLSLTVGNENTFNNLDAGKLPLYISASVDGILVSKSQVLSVPVAEYAKRSGVLTKEILMSKTWSVYNRVIKFDSSTVTVADEYSTRTYNYAISGDIVYAWGSIAQGEFESIIFVYLPELGELGMKW